MYYELEEALDDVLQKILTNKEIRLLKMAYFSKKNNVDKNCVNIILDKIRNNNQAEVLKDFLC
jgi:hypothetical protein